MTPSVAIIAPGSMGAGIGQRLTEHKVTVLTSLAGRTEASAKRAREAGMQPVEDRALAEADFLLSIVPPGDAVALARRLAPRLTAKAGQHEHQDLCFWPVGQRLRQTQWLRVDRARARRAVYCGLGVEDVLRRHHQGLYCARYRHDARGNARWLGRGAQGRAGRQPAGPAALSFEPGAIHVFQGLPLGG